MFSTLSIGDSIFSRIDTPTDFTTLLKENLPDSDPIIVKADWVAMEEDTPRSLEALRCLIEAASGRVIVTEGHLLWRPRELEPKGLRFMADDAELDWDGLLEGKGWRWLIHKRADWGFFIDGPHWSHLMKEERLWLEKHGFTDFFKDNGIEYVNATDEIWSGRTADPKIVKEAVESRYPPAFTAKLYGFVPEKLFRHRGSALVSLSKRKEYQSFTMKNVFGLIPDPVRAWWHGRGNRRLAKSILDINKVYGALFQLVGVFEAPRGDESNPFTRDVAVSGSVAQLDAILNHVTGCDIKDAGYIPSGNGLFGSYNSELLREAEARLSGWFPAPTKAP
ncbi:DUF362 domain-containing protein [Candidatus Bathyarchaeota archaeon]|nr:DUF362 domain-containing protein [Candidatus Bathyarchaeota archaeon]